MPPTSPDSGIPPPHPDTDVDLDDTLPSTLFVLILIFFLVVGLLRVSISWEFQQNIIPIMWVSSLLEINYIKNQVM
jgi:hypothetical protein